MNQLNCESEAVEYKKHIGQVEPTPEPSPVNPEQPGDDQEEKPA